MRYPNLHSPPATASGTGMKNAMTIVGPLGAGLTSGDAAHIGLDPAAGSPPVDC